MLPVESVVDSDVPESNENEPVVEATYEDNFMRQVRNIGTTRHRRIPERLRPNESSLTECTTGEQDELVKEALNGKHSERWKELLKRNIIR